jgi:site-specific DNA-cytosine methylase
MSHPLVLLSQTFPDGFMLGGSRKQRYNQLGTAVPVKFARAVAEHLRLHMAVVVPWPPA